MLKCKLTSYQGLCLHQYPLPQKWKEKNNYLKGLKYRFLEENKGLRYQIHILWMSPYLYC